MNSSLTAGWLADKLKRSAHPWPDVIVLAQVGSTNAYLAGLARSGAPDGTVVVTESQNAGRGRFTRAWTTPPGSAVAVSALLRPPASVPASRWPWLPLLTGLAVVDGLSAAADLRPALKWPNDVLLDERKVCGILAEQVGGAVVIGLGINTAMTLDQLPVPTATSLAIAGADVANGEVVAQVLLALARWYRRWCAGEDLRPDYLAASATLGRPVRVETAPGRSRSGRACGIDPDGRLLVEIDGVVEPFAAGDVFHLR